MNYVKKINPPFFEDESGDLTALEIYSQIPFDPVRVFIVRAGDGATRGMHAHKKCSQMLICAHGRIEVYCDNGTEKETYILDSTNKCLNIQPGVWATEKFLTEKAVLVVLCDRPYEEDDYIHSYDEFKIHCKAKKGE